MNSESKETSVASISDREGQTGSFLLYHYHFKKHGRTILLTANGNSPTILLVFVNIIIQENVTPRQTHAMLLVLLPTSTTRSI